MEQHGQVDAGHQRRNAAAHRANSNDRDPFNPVGHAGLLLGSHQVPDQKSYLAPGD